jgi:chemotaxis protein MotB
MPPAGPQALRASGDRWLFGYADIVTLLFACFASLYAARLTPPSPEPPVRQTDDGPAVTGLRRPAAATAVVADRSGDLASELGSLVGREGTLPGLEVAVGVGGLIVSVPEAGSFALAQTELSPAARAVMLELAALLKDRGHHIRVEGHTDDVPIRSSRFASNWELSTARATTVVQLLVEDGGLAAERLAAAGYAEHRPRVPNDTVERRARNRRVDIVILDPATADEADAKPISDVGAAPTQAGE